MARRIRFSIWIIILLVVAGCNLNNTTGNGVIAGVPVVQIISPQANAAYLQGVSVNVQAQISNAGADIDRVEVALDDGLIATISQPNPDGKEAFAITHGWLAAGLGDHRLGVTAFRADGSASNSATVTITVVNDEGSGTAAQNAGTPESTHIVLPTVTPPNQQVQPVPTTAAPTQPPQPTAASNNQAASGGTGTATANFSQSINVRRGPGTDFDPPIGAYGAGQTAQILALSTGGDWYKVRYGGGEGWVLAQLVTTTGDVSSLPRDPGPAHPTSRPMTATAVVPTQPSAAQSGANLVAGIVVLNPSSPVCNETFTVGLDVANLGTEATSASSTVSLVDVRSADGTTQGTTLGGFPVIQPGQTVRVDMPLTISTWYNETHRITLVIDPNNVIPESNPNDNAISLEYTLNKGGC